MSEPVVLPGGRDVRGSLDSPDRADSCVVACPPHPQLGGSRSDGRLTAVADALGERGVACLRFDYGPWDEGGGERRDAARAVEWATERYAAVGVFGYSFGGAVALLTAAERAGTRAVAALAPAPRLPDGSDAVDAVGRVDRPALVVCGERDETVDCEAVAAAARAAGHVVESVPADHHFVGQADAVGSTVAAFLAEQASAVAGD